MLIAELMTSFQDDPDWLLCQKFNDKCHLELTYNTLSELLSACRVALLCKEEHVLPLDILVLDINFCLVPGETDLFEIKLEQ